MMTGSLNWEAFITDATDDERALRRAAFHALLSGEAVDQGHLASATGFAPDKVGSLLGQLTNRGLIVVEPDSGHVVGSCGLSSSPTDHRLDIRGRQLFTWCAEDAVGIPAALREDARVLSHCRHCGGSVTIDMAGGDVARAEPPQTCLWVTPLEVGRSVVGFT